MALVSSLKARCKVTFKVQIHSKWIVFHSLNSSSSQINIKAVLRTITEITTTTVIMKNINKWQLIQWKQVLMQRPLIQNHLLNLLRIPISTVQQQVGATALQPTTPMWWAASHSSKILKTTQSSKITTTMGVTRILNNLADTNHRKVILTLWDCPRITKTVGIEDKRMEKRW